jgi:hypothetical protein
LLSKIQELKIANHSLSEPNLEEKKQIFERIQKLDDEANRALASKSFLTHLLTSIRSFFGNNGRNIILKNSYIRSSLINEFDSAVALKGEKRIPIEKQRLNSLSIPEFLKEWILPLDNSSVMIQATLPIMFFAKNLMI